MKFARAQLVLVTVFIMFLFAHVGTIVFAYVRGSIYASDLQGLLVRILAIYSIPLGVIIGGIFGREKLVDDTDIKTAFWATFAMAMVWNILLAVRTVAFAFAAGDSVASLSEYLEKVSAAGLFLVGGALAYFFASRKGQ